MNAEPRGALTLAPANDNATPPASPLLCVACRTHEAVSMGYCAECIADANAHYDERRGAWEGERP